MSLKRYWYTKPSTTTSPLVASSYTIVGSRPSCPTSGNNVCTIYAYGGGAQPAQGNFTINGNLYNYINDAVSSTNDQPASGFVFVYTRT